MLDSIKIGIKESPHSELKNYPYRVIVAGSRWYSDYDYFSKQVFAFLEHQEIKKGEVIFLSGDAKGPDRMIIRWCKEHEFPYTVHKAKWDVLDISKAVIRYTNTGKPYNCLAGLWRNKEMAELANKLLAFYDGVSTDTRDMIQLMTELKYNVRTIIVDKEENI